MTFTTRQHLGLLAALWLAVAGPGAAATYVVNTTDIDLPDTNTALAGCDANPVVNGDQCTLRAAIMQANASAGADTIVVPLGVTITLTQMGFGGAESGDLDISAPVTITAVPLGFPADFGDLPRIGATFAERLFDIGQDVSVTFRGLVLEDGAPAGVAGTNGGAMRITAGGAEVLVDRVRFQDNAAATGAAIANSGQLVVEGSDFLANVATTGAAAIQTNAGGHTTLRGSSIREIRNAGVTREALRVSAGGTLVVENSDIDGASQLGAPPPTPTTGIRADRPALLAIRNSTLVDFTDHALDLVTDATTTVRVYNSILAGSQDLDCVATAIAGAPADQVFDFNLVQTGTCNGAVGGGNWIAQPPILGGIESSANRFFVARRPLLGSRALDGGAPADAPGNDPLRFCPAADILGTPRPLDGDANGIPRCDMGAVESATLTSSTYVVGVYDVDLPDINPGDNRCDADAVAVGTQCTLRAAVMEANAKPGPDRITFTGGGNRTVTLTRAGAGGADVGDLDIGEQLTIEGAADPQSPDTVAIRDNVGDRVFDVALPDGQAFRMRDVQVGFGSGDFGAGVRVSATLAEFERVSFANNVVSASGGALSASGGLLTVRDSDFSFNQAAVQGSAIHSAAETTVIENSSLRDNTSPGDGAALAASGSTSLIVRNTTLHRNSSGIRADGTLVVDVRASTIAGHAQHGLLVASGAVIPTVSVRGTVFADNADHCQFIGGFGANTMAWNHVDVADAQCAPAASNSSVGPALIAPEARRDTNGTSWYRVPLHGSPLVDAIPGDAGPMLCSGQDQRGLPRPADSDGDGDARCDIGAVETTLAEAAPREFIVTTLVDDDDTSVGDGLCRRLLTNESCSLRAAVMEANALPGPDRIILPANAAPYALTIPQAAGPDDATGDLRISDGLTIRGVVDSAGARPTIAASHGDRLFAIVNANTPVILEGLRLTAGQTPFSGGAITILNSSAVSLRQLDIHGNSAAAGGGAIDASSSTILIEDSDLHDNHSDGQGAAIQSDTSFLEIRRSSIRANTDAGVGAEQEAVHADGDGSTLVQDSTLSGNAGTALRIVDGDLEVRNTTLSGNSRRGVEFARLTGRNLLIRNTVLAGNGLGACSVTGAGDAGIATDAYNLTQGTGCDLHAGTSNIVNPVAGLTELVVDPAAFSAYHLPLSGSPLLDAGHPDVSALGCSATDQLGAIRPVDADGNGIARCDIGAIESAPFGEDLFADGFE